MNDTSTKISPLSIALIVLAILSLVSFAGNIASASPQFAVASAGQSLLQKITAPFAKLAQVINPPARVQTVVKVVDEQSQVIDVVKKNSPAVVSIIASAQVPKMSQCFQQMPAGPGFNIRVPVLCQNGTELQRVGAGSGFIVTSDGYIVTNNHVVDDPKAQYTVVLNDTQHVGQKMSAKVLARDTVHDVAIVKIEASGLPVVSFGSSLNLQVGQTAVAIGYALGQFDNTVSKGVVSGLSRSIVAGDAGGSGATETLTGLIQTDAAINPGNSGGPLLDIDGNAIGMNTAVAQAQGIGFATPINVVKQDFDQVRNSGTIVQPAQPFIGVRYVPVTNELQANQNLPYNYGMLILKGGQGEAAVQSGSPAEKAGLAEGDIILEADGKQLNEQFTLADAIANKKPGDTVSLKVSHNGQTRNVSVMLGTK